MNKLINSIKGVFNKKKPENTESQKVMILAHLKSGKSITPIEALNKYGCFRLGARILDLRNDGFNINTEMIEVNGKRFAKYSL